MRQLEVLLHADSVLKLLQVTDVRAFDVAVIERFVLEILCWWKQQLMDVVVRKDWRYFVVGVVVLQVLEDRKIRRTGSLD